MATVLVYTSSAAGHLYPLMPGLMALRDRGHEVHVRTIDKHVQTVRDHGIDAEPADPRIDAMEITDYKAKAGGERLRRGITDLIKRGGIQAPDFDRAVEEVRPDVVLVDAINYGAMTRAEALDLPWALFMPSLLPLKGKGIPAYGTGMKPMAGPIGRARDAVMWKVAERMYGKAVLPGLNELRAESGLAPLKSPFEMFEAADRLMITSGEPLEYERSDLPEKIDFVGPQLWDPPAEAPAWLDEPGDPWILVTCSTDFTKRPVPASSRNRAAAASVPARLAIAFRSPSRTRSGLSFLNGSDSPAPASVTRRATSGWSRPKGTTSIGTDS